MNRRNFIPVCLAVLLVALALRVSVILRNPIPAGDGNASNVLMADNLLRGQGFTTFVKWTLYDDSMELLRPEANRQPVLACLLAGWFFLAGTGYLQAQVLSLLIGMAAMVLPAVWAGRLFGRKVLLAVLAYLALDPPFVWFSAHADSLLLYVCLFYLILIVAWRERISWLTAVMLGVLTGVLYLIRTQGVLMVPALAIWIFIRGTKKRWLKVAVFGLTALVVVSPWLVRNFNEFGDPTYSQNGQFLLNENHWSAWSVREEPPSPGDMLRNQGAGAVVRYVLAGGLRVLEPFTTGTLHRGEIFGQPGLLVFTFFLVLSLAKADLRRKMLLPGLALLPVMAVLVLHQHSGRYLAVAVPAVLAAGSAGLFETLSDKGRRIIPWLVLVVGFSLVSPLLRVLMEDSRERYAESMEAARWLSENADDSSWVCTYPNVELFHWIYRKPTLAWPNDYEMLMWPYLQGHDVQYMVVDPDLPRLRPWLSRIWRRSPDGLRWEPFDLPPFLGEVWRSSSGMTIIYEFTAEVPEGYMEVDSIPPDNRRAIGPH